MQKQNRVAFPTTRVNNVPVNLLVKKSSHVAHRTSNSSKKYDAGIWVHSLTAGKSTAKFSTPLPHHIAIFSNKHPGLSGIVVNFPTGILSAKVAF